MVRIHKTLILFSLFLLAGCFSGEKYSQSHVIVRPGMFGAIFESVRWSPDGSHIAFIRDDDLWIKNMTTKNEKKIVSNVLVLNSGWVDSKTILYYASNGEMSIYGNLYLVDINSRESTLIAEDVKSVQEISTVNHKVFLSTGREGVRTIMLNESGAETIQEEFPIETGEDFKVSPTGDKIAFENYVGYDDNTRTWKWVLSYYDMETGDIHPFDHLSQYFSIYSYCWSPDGKYVAFSGQAEMYSDPHLYVYKVEGNEPPLEITDIADFNAVDMDWSPTKNQLVIVSVIRPGRNEIRLIDLPEKI